MPLTPAERFAALSPEEQAAALAAAAGPPTPEPAAPPPGPDLEVDDPADLDDLADLDDFFDDTLPLRFRGVEYVLHAADVELGLLCERIWSGSVGRSGRAQQRVKAQAQAEEVLDEDSSAALTIRLLGGQQDAPGYDPDRDVYAQLKAAGLPWRLVEHMGTTAFLWTVDGRESALSFWHAGGADPKAPADAQPQPPAPRQPQDHKAADRASMTLPPASTSSTTSRSRRGTRGGKSGGTGA